MLKAIISQFTEYFYLANNGENTCIFLYQPYQRFKPLGKGYLKIDAYYLASNSLYHLTKKLLTVLSQYGAEEVTDDIKTHFETFHIGARLKNSLIAISPYGSSVALSIIKLKIQCEPFLPTEFAHCNDCGLCQNACPTNALENGFNRAKCLRNGQDIVDSDIYDYTLLDNSILGCDKCQIYCPLNSADYIDMPEDLKDILKIENFTEYAKNGKKQFTLLDNYIGKNMVKITKMLYFATFADVDSKMP